LTDLVVWPSHPLALGATPLQVYIDQIPQIEFAFPTKKKGSENDQSPPRSANYSQSFIDSFTPYKGLSPPKLSIESTSPRSIAFRNVKEIWVKDEMTGRVKDLIAENGFLPGQTSDLLVRDGRIECVGSSCLEGSLRQDVQILDLKGGVILPPITWCELSFPKSVLPNEA
jgi:hypothetical protein